MNKRWSVTAVVSMLLVAVVLTGLSMAQGPHGTPPGLARAIAAQEAHTDALLGRPGVVGTAVGLDDQGSPVVKIYVEHGNVAALPHSVNGVPTEVEVTGELVAQQTRPSPTGVSTGNERLIISNGSLYCTTGTLGARVKIGSNVYALSNAHVYALAGSTPDGTVQYGASTGDRILQPGRVDMTQQACGSTQEINAAVIGHLVASAPIDPNSTSNTVDAAIALVTTGTVGQAVPGYCGGYTPSATTTGAQLGMLVKKCGRTTNLTKGKVSAMNATVLISYDTGQVRFENQIVVKGSRGQFSAGGDSGSLIVTQSGGLNPSPVALLFAGGQNTTIGNPIGLVLGALGITIDGP